MIGTLPDGTRGFDANRIVSSTDAAAFYAKGFRYAIRYVRRYHLHPFDLTAREASTITNAGLGLMVVQHVAPEGWSPIADDGALYGNTAARDAATAGYRTGATIWCDLEGVAPRTAPEVVADYANEWYDAVAAMGFTPGLYVGDSCGLSANDLYQKLKFGLYWSGYNLNRDRFPAVRGVAMRQRSVAAGDIIFGYDNQNMDVDIIGVDALGATPTLMLP